MPTTSLKKTQNCLYNIHKVIFYKTILHIEENTQKGS